MIPLTLREIADAVGGRLAGGAAPDAVVDNQVLIDSRHLTPGSLFIAVVGENHDGHDFADAAMAAGAVAVVSAHELDVPCIIVDDTVVALGRLARAVLDRLPDLVVVGVTGSSGKTSTKDLLMQVLPVLGDVVAPLGSLNNETGLPTTALQVRVDTRILLSEMGSRGLGHIAYLCALTPPRIGVVLNVGTAHVGEFGGKAEIALAKGELVEALPDAAHGGVAVLNADDPLVLAMRTRTQAAVLTFGESPEADVRAVDVVLDDQARACFTLVHDGGSVPVALRLHGRHHVGNALATAAVALALGMRPQEVAARLSSAGPASRWRMEVTTASSGVTVVNDAYNANPESVRSALEALVAMARPTDDVPLRRSWAVLGEMRELGESTGVEHEAIGRLAARLDVDRVVVVGEEARPIWSGVVHEDGGEGRSSVVPDVHEAIALVRAQARPGDVVLVKASRAAGLERVAEALLEVSA
jgi:UDP-N-acetylmuramoyl-tripeptide--D-alanyl-D-alanine ligase